MGFDVIVPTRNNAPTLGTLLTSVNSSTVHPSSVVVVDGSSEDETRSIARDLGADVLSYDCRGDMRGYARNLGAASTSGGLLVFLDSDMEVSPGLFAECQSMLKLDLGGIIVPEQNVGSGLLGAVRGWERSLVQLDLYLSFARILRRRVFEQTGGFDVRILGFEDLDMQATLMEQGIKLGRCDSIIKHHEESLSFASYLRKRRYYHATSSLLKRKHPEFAKVAFSPLRRLRMYASGLSKPRNVVYFVAALGMRAVELA